MAIECGRGHLYDPSIYSACPYCNSGQQAVQFGGTPVGAGGRTMPLSGGQSPAGGQTVPLGGQPAYGGVPVGQDGKTMPIGAAAAAGAGYNPQPTWQAGQPSPSVVSDGKTLPPKEYDHKEKSVADDNKTIAMIKKKMGLDPVVGWLVCVAGKQKGQDYKIKGQINSIGRSEKMDICIKGDETITEVNHARLSYSERHNRFNLIPAESKNVIFLNDEEIFAATLLSPYDIIDFGETKLIFVPLCCDKFDWDSNKDGGDGHGVV